MNSYTKTLGRLLQLAVMFIGVSVISVFTPDRFMLRKPATILLMVLAVILQLYFSEHIIDRRVRLCLTSAAAMICLWIILRGAKYIAFEESEVFARHIWYMYYVPALAIAQLSLYAALFAGRREGERLPALSHASAVLTAAFMAMMLTNDIHRLAFDFKPGFADWDSDYSRGPLFVAVYIWIVILHFASLFILFRRCRLSESRRLIWIPLIPVVFGFTYLTLYASGLLPRIAGSYFGELPEAVCFMIAGVWLGFVGIGLIPSNEDYGGLFSVSGLAAQIADRDLNVVYRSAGASWLTKAQLASGSTVMLDPDTRLHRRAVKGGFIYWQDDIAELNRVNSGLEELGEKLAEEAELIRLENELREERAQIEARTAVYDGIARNVLPQSKRIGELCEEAEADPDVYDKNVRLICLLGTFIKRYSNLSLLAADSSLISSGELQLAVSETMRRLADIGPSVSIGAFEKGALPAEFVLGAYRSFFVLCEAVLPVLKGVSAAFAEGCFRFSLEGAGGRSFDGALAAGAESFSEDGVLYVRIPTAGEGGND